VKAELLATSPMLYLPIMALFLFMAIFIGIFVVTMRKRAVAYDPVARLPLDDGNPLNHSHDEGGER
jgi:hypothetical protein